MRSLHIKPISKIACILLLCSCSRPPVENADRRQSQGFPVVGSPSVNSCGTPEPQPIDICDWKTSTDLVAVGTIESLKLVRDPCVSPTPDGETMRIAPDETTAVARALEIQLRIASTLHGESPDTVSVRISPDRLGLWLPQPVTASSGRGQDIVENVEWTDSPENSKGPLPTGPFVVGQQVGMSLLKMPQGWYTPVLPFFDFTSDGMAFPSERCVYTYPDAVRNLDVDGVRELLSACGSDGPQLFYFDQDEASLRAQYDLGRCFVTDTAECHLARDCGRGRCESGRCIDQ